MIEDAVSRLFILHYTSGFLNPICTFIVSIAEDWHFNKHQIDKIKVDIDTAKVSCWYKSSFVPGGVLII